MLFKDLKMIKDYAGEAPLSVVAVPVGVGARSHSKVKTGWIVKINGEPMSSARNEVRLFASLDTVTSELGRQGVSLFTVSSGQPVAVPAKAPKPRSKAVDKALKVSKAGV